MGIEEILSIDVCFFATNTTWTTKRDSSCGGTWKNILVFENFTGSKKNSTACTEQGV
jgi:hypothetical protein